MEYWKDGELSEEISDEIENCKDLEQLFKCWIQAQQKIKTEINCLKNTGYFVKDGYIDEKEYRKSCNDQKILFILKESHILQEDNYKNKEKIKIDKQMGFYNDFFKQYTTISKEQIYKIDKNNMIVPVAYVNKEKYYKYFDNKPKQKEKIARMAKYIIDNKVTSNYDELCKALKQVAFMNINKMGGTARTDLKNLKLYYKKYKKFILKEIELLKPNVIVVMCGFNEIIEDLEKKYIDKEKVKIIKMLHTAVRGRHLNLKDEKEIKYYKKYINEDLNEVKGPFVKCCKTTLEYLVKFIIAYEESSKH